MGEVKGRQYRAFCTACGAENTNDTGFCTACGSPVARTSSTSDATQTTVLVPSLTTPPRRRVSSSTLIMGALGAMLLGAGIWYALRPPATSSIATPATVSPAQSSSPSASPIASASAKPTARATASPSKTTPATPAQTSTPPGVAAPVQTPTPPEPTYSRPTNPALNVTTVEDYTRAAETIRDFTQAVNDQNWETAAKLNKLWSDDQEQNYEKEGSWWPWLTVYGVSGSDTKKEVSFTGQSHQKPNVKTKTTDCTKWDLKYTVERSPYSPTGWEIIKSHTNRRQEC